MQIPDEFYDFCRYLHQDSMMVYGPNIEDVISGALEHMDTAHRSVLRKFIGHLLAGGYSDDELQAIYRTTDAEIGIRNDKGIRHFLAMVRDAIA